MNNGRLRRKFRKGDYKYPAGQVFQGVKRLKIQDWPKIKHKFLMIFFRNSDLSNNAYQRDLILGVRSGEVSSLSFYHAKDNTETAPEGKLCYRT